MYRNGKRITPKPDDYRATVKYAIETAKRTGESYFVYRDFDEYHILDEQWQIISERMYHECFCLPETWVKAFIDASGIVESY